MVNRSRTSVGRRRIEEIRRATFDLHERNIVTEVELRSIVGKIRYATWLNESQGTVLQKLADALLPRVVQEHGKRRRPERRDCKAFSDDHTVSEHGVQPETADVTGLVVEKQVRDLPLFDGNHRTI